MTAEVKPVLETPPSRIAKLPVFRGYPVPWFVEWLPTGEPEFRAFDQEKLVRAVKEKLCWVCGEKLGAYRTFVIGPMCAVNRISAEPPSHLECAEYSVRNCPFLSKPQMVRREAGMPEQARNPAGFMITRNPGVTLLWTTRSYQLVKAPGGVLFEVGHPTSTTWWREGRLATRAEVEESTTTGLPALQQLCASAMEHIELGKRLSEAMELWPKEVSHAALSSTPA